MQFLDFFDFLTNSVMMPIAAIATCLLISRVVGVKKVEEEVLYGRGNIPQKKDFQLYDPVHLPDFCRYYPHQFGGKCFWLDCDVTL